MPTNRTRRTRKILQEVSDAELYFASDGLYPEPEGGNKFELLELKFFTNHRDLWQLVREQILSDWIQVRPGTRPSWWWIYEAPKAGDETLRSLRITEKFYQGRGRERFCEPRQRLGGIGSPKHEVLAHAPCFSYGLPNEWVSQHDEDLYNGRLTDVNGEKILSYHEGDFKGVAVSPLDPPRFESQAAYLRRLGLLQPGELRRLKDSDFEPEVLALEMWSEAETEGAE